MISRKALISMVSATVTVGLLSGCGGDPNMATSLQAYQQAYYQMLNAQNQDCCCEEPETTTPGTNTGNTPVTTTSPTPAPVTSTPGTSNPVGDTPAPTPTQAPATGNNVSKGDQALAKILSVLNSANAIEAEVDKYEKGLKDGRVVENGIKLYSRKPSQVKLEITYHTNSGSVGAKLIYNSKDKKVKIRPGGALSLITTDLDMTDDRVVSPNDFTPAQSDLFGLVSHLSVPGISAEITGKSSINGVEIYLLKVTTASANTLHPDITHETVGFEPGTFKVRLWEAYTNADTKPFLKYNIKKLEIKSSLPDSVFKL